MARIDNNRAIGTNDDPFGIPKAERERLYSDFEHRVRKSIPKEADYYSEKGKPLFSKGAASRAFFDFVGRSNLKDYENPKDGKRAYDQIESELSERLIKKGWEWDGK